MPDVTDLHTVLDSKTPAELEARMREIRIAAKGDWKSLTDDQLREIVVIAAKLRQKNVGPPKKKPASGPVSLNSLDI